MTIETHRAELQRRSRARIRAERGLAPSAADLGDGYFALHIQYGGGAVIVRVGGGNGPPGSGDVEAFREWLDALDSVSVGSELGSDPA